MATAMDMEGRRLFATREIIPLFKPSAKFPQQCLRHDAPNFTLDDGNDNVQVDNDEFLSTLPGSDEDDGSYLPVTPLNASANNSSESNQISSKMFLHTSLENNTNSGSAAVVEGKKTRTLRPGDFFKICRSKVSKITRGLAKRVEIGGDNIVSTTCNPIVTLSNTPGHGSSSTESPSCNSDSKAEFRNNLTSWNDVGTEASPVNGDLHEIEFWNYLASTFVEKEEILVKGKKKSAANSFHEADDSSEPGNKVRAEPNVLITATYCDGEIELFDCAATAMMKEFDKCAAASSQVDPPLSSSSHCSIMTASSISKGSNSSNSTQGILLSPKRAIGRYDLFGNFVFSISEAARPQQRVHFSNMSKLNEKCAIDSHVKARPYGTLPSDCSDDSSTSFEYVMKWCGVPGDLNDA